MEKLTELPYLVRHREGGGRKREREREGRRLLMASFSFFKPMTIEKLGQNDSMATNTCEAGRGKTMDYTFHRLILFI